MKTRRIPTPQLPAPPPITTMLAITAITLTVMLYAVSLFGTGTFDAGILMTEPGERVSILTSYAVAMWRMLTDPIGSGRALPCCQQGVNTAHPLVTLGIGGLLSLVPPHVASVLASGVTAAVFIAAAVLFLKRFAGWRWAVPLVAYILAYPGVYEELRNPSMLPLKIAALVACILFTDRGWEDILTGICWFVAILFDPLLLLLAIPLGVARRYRILAVGAGLYLLSTIPYLIFPIGASYRQVLIDTVIFPAGAYTVASVARFVPVPTVMLWIPILAGFAVLVLMQIRHRISPGTLIGIWAVCITAVSGATIPSSYLIVPVVTALLIARKSVAVTPFLFSAMIALIVPSPILWFRIGAYGSLLSSRDIGIAAIWTVYWSVAVVIGLTVGMRSATIRR